MSKRVLFAAAAVMGVAAFAVPSSAQIAGSGPCEGVTINNAWVDWYSGRIRARVDNHTAGTRNPHSVLFRVELSVDGKVGVSPSERLPAGSFLDVNVTTTQEMFGKSPTELEQANHRSMLDPFGYFVTGGLLGFTDCMR